MLVIATRPGRVVQNSRNAVQKYAVVQQSGKFQFVTDINQATTFTSASAFLRAIGIRARALKGTPTGDLTWAEVEQVGVRQLRIANGS